MLRMNHLLALLMITTFTTANASQAIELHFEKDDALPLAYISVAIEGGALQDPQGKNGLTAIMANAMLRGTKNKTKQQIDIALDSMGASLAVETRLEFIVFRGAVLSENLDAFLSLVTEILTLPSFRPSEIEKLKKEYISNLMVALNNDRQIVSTRFDQLYFQGTPYGKSADGTISGIRAIQSGDLLPHYQNTMSQNRMIILGAGDSDKSAFRSFEKSLSDSLKTHSNSAAASTLASAALIAKAHPTTLEVAIFDKPERTQTQVLFGQKGLAYNDPNFDALQIANFAFGGGSFLSRLLSELRVKRGWTYGAASGFKIGKQPHTWRVSFFPKNSDTPAAVKVAWDMIRELKQNGITQKEFEFAKNSIVNSAGFSYNTPQKRLDNRLMEIIYDLPEGYIEKSADRIESISLEEVNSALKAFIQPDQMMIGLVATAKETQKPLAKALGIPEKKIHVQDFRKE